MTSVYSVNRCLTIFIALTQLFITVQCSINHLLLSFISNIFFWKILYEAYFSLS